MIAMFDHESHLEDLILKEKKILNKNKLGTAEIVEMIPHQLSLTKEMIEESYGNMIQNFNFYKHVMSPLHNHKSFD